MPIANKCSPMCEKENRSVQRDGGEVDAAAAQVVEDGKLKISGFEIDFEFLFSSRLCV
jgi:hypothetical protein